MKKIITIALVLVVSISMVFAADGFDSFKADLKANEAKGFAESLEGYKPSNPQSMGMGGAGLAINDGLDSLFYNGKRYVGAGLNHSFPCNVNIKYAPWD